jgi:endoglucanase
MNEPRLKGTQLEWYINPRDAKSKEAVHCINILNQAFVDTVRASGGMNATRYLMVSGYAASLNGVMHQDFTMPEDSIGNRIIVSVHAYVPYSFALQGPNQSGSQSVFDTGSRSDRSDIDNLMQKLYKEYIKIGIPVVLGEFGARDKSGNLQDRADFIAYYVAAASAHGIPCFIWDNHAFSGSGELFGLLNRNTYTFAYPEIIESMITYALNSKE